MSGGRTQTGPGGAALPGDVEKKKARVFALLPCPKWARGSKHPMMRSFWDRETSWREPAIPPGTSPEGRGLLWGSPAGPAAAHGQ